MVPGRFESFDGAEIGSSCPYPAIPPPVNVALTVLPPHPCVYRPGREAQIRVLWSGGMSGETYKGFMNAGFRRSGRLLYQPICTGCRACMPIRVSVDSFRPSKSHRRCLRRNADLRISASAPDSSEEKFELYQRYVTQWHGGSADSRENFEAFLYDSPVESVEFEYRDAEKKLLAVGICDVCGDALSSVYFYFDPAAAHRGLGTFGALREIEFARAAGISYYYLGYWIEGCATMKYKIDFCPNELLHPDAVWRAAGR